MCKIAILIAFRNPNSHLEKSTEVIDLENCLKSILNSIIKFQVTSKNEFTTNIFVVDDHSKNKYSHLIPSSITNQITIINNKGLQGQGNALNYALKEINASYYMFTDSDCIVEENWINNIINFFYLNPDRSCVVGPNWTHQIPERKWQRFITNNESQLMKFIFESYVDYNQKSSLRIDCRNLAIKDSFFDKSTTTIFSSNIFANSSQTSIAWRNSTNGIISLVGFDSQIIVYHKYIPSLRTQIKKYYQRGKYGAFKKIYSKNYDSLVSAFIKYYFNRHFIRPLKITKVSIFYLWLVHLGFWMGIIMHKPINKC